MALSTSANKVVHAGNGVATSFAYTFPILEASHLSVIYTDAGGNAVTLAPSLYSTTGVGGLAGGAVTYPLSGPALANGETLTLLRTVPLTQTTVLSNQGAYYPEVVEGRFDRVYMALQQLDEEISRAQLDPPGATNAHVVPALEDLKALTVRYESVLVKTGQGAGVWAWVGGSTTTANDGTVVTCPVGDAGRYKRIYSGLLDVTWFGASPTASAATNTAAFDAALALGDVFVPAGTYDVTSLASITGRLIKGQGRENTVIRTTSASANVVTVASGGYVAIEKVQFQSSVTRSGGSFIHVAGGAFSLEDFLISGAFTGITIADGIGDWEIISGRFDNTVATTGNSIIVGTGTGTGPVAGRIIGVVADNPTGARPESHVKVVNAGDIAIDQSHFIHAVANLKVVPGNSQVVASIKSVNTAYDQAGTYNMHIAPTGTGAVQRSTFVGGWMAQAGTKNAYLAASGSATINGIDFSGMDNYDSVDGIHADGAGVDEVLIHGGHHADNSGKAIWLTDVNAGGVRGASITPFGGFGANGVGILLDGATDNVIVTLNDVSGNSTAITNSASGTANVVRNNPGHTGTAWTTSTPTPVPSSGAFTATCTLHYEIIDKLLKFDGVVSISDNGTAPAAGTGGGYVQVPIPVSNVGRATTGRVTAGRENALTGNMLQGHVGPGGGNFIIQTYDNKYPGGTGAVIYFSGEMEIA